MPRQLYVNNTAYSTYNVYTDMFRQYPFCPNLSNPTTSATYIALQTNINTHILPRCSPQQPYINDNVQPTFQPTSPGIITKLIGAPSKSGVPTSNRISRRRLHCAAFTQRASCQHHVSPACIFNFEREINTSQLSNASVAIIPRLPIDPLHPTPVDSILVVLPTPELDSPLDGRSLTPPLNKCLFSVAFPPPCTDYLCRINFSNKSLKLTSSSPPSAGAFDLPFDRLGVG
jgi:hypothetical protein